MRRYEIVFGSVQTRKSWISLEQELPNFMQECREYLEQTPEDRLKSNNRLKKLKGRYKGILQYDVTKNDARVWYIVDRENRCVVIKRAGHHPDKY